MHVNVVMIKLEFLCSMPPHTSWYPPADTLKLPFLDIKSVTVTCLEIELSGKHKSVDVAKSELVS